MKSQMVPKHIYKSTGTSFQLKFKTESLLLPWEKDPKTYSVLNVCSKFITY